MDALQNFDKLPNDAHVRVKVVADLFSCSVPTVWRDVRAGRLPKPRKLSPRRTAWRVGDLRAVLAKGVLAC